MQKYKAIQIWSQTKPKVKDLVYLGKYESQASMIDELVSEKLIKLEKAVK